MLIISFLLYSFISILYQVKILDSLKILSQKKKDFHQSYESQLHKCNIRAVQFPNIKYHRAQGRLFIPLYKTAPQIHEHLVTVYVMASALCKVATRAGDWGRDMKENTGADTHTESTLGPFKFWISWLYFYRTVKNFFFKSFFVGCGLLPSNVGYCLLCTWNNLLS